MAEVDIGAAAEREGAEALGGVVADDIEHGEGRRSEPESGARVCPQSLGHLGACGERQGVGVEAAPEGAGVVVVGAEAAVEGVVALHCLHEQELGGAGAGHGGEELHRPVELVRGESGHQLRLLRAREGAAEGYGEVGREGVARVGLERAGHGGAQALHQQEAGEAEAEHRHEKEGEAGLVRDLAEGAPDEGSPDRACRAHLRACPPRGAARGRSARPAPGCGSRGSRSPIASAPRGRRGPSRWRRCRSRGSR